MMDLEGCIRKRFKTSDSCRLVPGFPLTKCEKDSFQIAPMGLLETISQVAPRLDCSSRPFSKEKKSCPRPLRSRPMLTLQDLQLCKGIGFQIKEIGDRLCKEQMPQDNIHWITATDEINKIEIKAAAVLQKIGLLRNDMCKEELFKCIVKMRQARSYLQNPNHDAYIYSLVLIMLSRVTQLGRMPHALLFFGSTRVDSAEEPPHLILFREAVTTSLEHLIQGAHPGSVDAIHVLSWLCSTCFALAFCQNVFGYIDDNFTAKKIGLVRLDETRSPKYLYYDWNNTILRVPTFGFLVKLLPSQSSSIVLNHHRVSGQTRQDESEYNAYSYNSDLLTLGASLQSLLRGKLKCSRNMDSAILGQLLTKWCSCDKIRLDRIRSSCTEEEAKICDRLVFKDLPKQLKCINAIPALQSRIFIPLFGYKGPVPREATIYTLDEV